LALCGKSMGYAAALPVDTVAMAVIAQLVSVVTLCFVGLNLGLVMSHPSFSVTINFLTGRLHAETHKDLRRQTDLHEYIQNLQRQISDSTTDEYLQSIGGVLGRKRNKDGPSCNVGEVGIEVVDYPSLDDTAIHLVPDEVVPYTCEFSETDVMLRQSKVGFDVNHMSIPRVTHVAQNSWATKHDVRVDDNLALVDFELAGSMGHDAIIKQFASGKAFRLTFFRPVRSANKHPPNKCAQLFASRMLSKACIDNSKCKLQALAAQSKVSGAEACAKEMVRENKALILERDKANSEVLKLRVTVEQLHQLLAERTARTPAPVEELDPPHAEEQSNFTLMEDMNLDELGEAANEQLEAAQDAIKNVTSAVQEKLERGQRKFTENLESALETFSPQADMVRAMSHLQHGLAWGASDAPDVAVASCVTVVHCSSENAGDVNLSVVQDPLPPPTSLGQLSSPRSDADASVHELTARELSAAASRDLPPSDSAGLPTISMASPGETDVLQRGSTDSKESRSAFEAPSQPYQPFEELMRHGSAASAYSVPDIEDEKALKDEKTLKSDPGHPLVEVRRRREVQLKEWAALAEARRLRGSEISTSDARRLRGSEVEV